MLNLSQRQNKIIEIILKRKEARSSDVHADLVTTGEDVSLVTVKRLLSSFASTGVLEVTSSGRSTSYRVSAFGRLVFGVDAHVYCSVEPDRRYGLKGYNFALFDALPSDPFTEDESAKLKKRPMSTRYALENYLRPFWKKNSSDSSSSFPGSLRVSRATHTHSSIPSGSSRLALKPPAMTAGKR